METFSPQRHTVQQPIGTRTSPAQLSINEGRYTVRLARTEEDIDAALRLRFEVFNLELNEGLESSYITGRDEDKFDASCHHLIVMENSSGVVIGTYRLRTSEMAHGVYDFYCDGEFDLSMLPNGVLADSLEIGRAGIALEHRNGRVLFLLWKGLVEYCRRAGKRYMFGCCSLTSQDPEEGIRAMIAAERSGWYHDKLKLDPRDGFKCRVQDTIVETGVPYKLPKLFYTYMRFGAKICSPPAIDRQFKTIDYFVLFDLMAMNETFETLFGS